MRFFDSGDEASPGHAAAHPDPTALVKQLMLQAGRAGNLIGGELDRKRVQQALADLGPALGSQMRGPVTHVAQLTQSAVHALAGSDDRYYQALGYQPLSPADAALAQAKQRDFKAQRIAADPINTHVVQPIQNVRHALEGSLEGSDDRYYQARGYRPPTEAKLKPLRGEQREFAIETGGPAIGVWAGPTSELGVPGFGAGRQDQEAIMMFPSDETAELSTHGGFVDVPGYARTSPATPGPSGPSEARNNWVTGATTGLGFGVMISNARRASDLAGPAMTRSVTLPIGGVSRSKDGNGHYVIGLNVSPLGKGLTLSKYPTSTKVNRILAGGERSGD